MDEQKNILLREWQRINQEILSDIYTDPDLAAQVSPEEIQSDLREMGVDPEAISVLWERIQDEVKRNKVEQPNDSNSVSKNQEETQPNSLGLHILPGLKELLAQLNLAFAAAESQPAIRDYVLWTADRQTMLLFTLQGDGSFLVSIWDSSEEPSRRLDDYSIVAADGTVLAKIVESNAQISATSIVQGLSIKDSTGKVLETHLQSP